MMTYYDYLPFTHDELPVQKTFCVDGTNYNIEVLYNDRFGFYTMIIKNLEDNVLLSTKLNYLTNALDALVAGLDLKRKILPALPENIESGVPVYSTIDSTNFDKIKVCLV